MSDRRSIVMTFKVEPELAELLREQPNTSEFIRQAVRDRIGHVCPLCLGNGRVSDLQRLAGRRLLNSHEGVVCTLCGAADFAPCHTLDEHVHDGPCADPWMAHIEHNQDYVCRSCFG
jgi:hypothetical protein